MGALLQEIGKLTILAIDAPFVARELFGLTKSKNNRPRIAQIGNNFRGWLLEKTEDPLGETTLCYAELPRRLLDSQILSELGGKAETMLAHIWALLERQPNGEKDALLTNGRANVFYVWDINRKSRAVYVFFAGGSWFVHASSVTNPLGWHPGCRIFYRDS